MQKGNGMDFVIVWELRARKGMEIAFEAAYGSEGDWARLFRTSPEYVRTELLRDASDNGRYLTIDVWSSAAEYENFRASYREEYEKIDAACEAMTEEEHEIGRFQRGVKFGDGERRSCEIHA